jgi:hypothetical protein
MDFIRFGSVRHRPGQCFENFKNVVMIFMFGSVFFCPNSPFMFLNEIVNKVIENVELFSRLLHSLFARASLVA